MKIKSVQKTLTIFVLFMGLSLILFGCGTAQPKANTQPTAPASEPATTPQTPVDPAAVARGLNIYTAQCKVCHGENGSGSGNGVPLTGKTPSASYIQSNMPRNKPGSLSSEQVSDLVAYITSLK